MAYTRSLPYQPNQKAVYKLSRSKLELFTQCQRCFWLDARYKISHPSTPPFQINKAIDELFKKEFDSYRLKKQPHPLMTAYKIDAVPFAHKELDKWRDNFVGVQAMHEQTNLLIFGAIDDVWVNPAGELIVVDYKATAKKGGVSLDAAWQDSYRRQMEIYQWLLRQNGFQVSNTGYFVYANGKADVDGFYDKVEFKTIIISHTGTSDWVDDTVVAAKKCLDGDIPPMGVSIMGGDCEHCMYARKRTELTLDYLKKTKK